MVTYEKESNFIKEFQIPIHDIGLKGITTDSQGNAWFYHSTNQTSSIIKLEPASGQFTSYDIEGNTIVDTPIINLAGGQIIFDDTRNVIWFTDARTNSVGKLDVESGKMELIEIPTPKAGPMGIVLSPDSNSVWFAEIIANKIGKLEVESNKIVEYFTGEETGPTLLTFDNDGILWVTLSYSNSVLRVQTGLLGSIISSGMSSTTLPKPDRFSPFGIAVISSNETQKIFISDHSSSRVISSDANSNFQSYTSYWTSPSKIYPATLPSQIASDKSGNIYFPQHGGNRISKISTESGIMTEYDIPTGPLSTAVFIAVSYDGKRVWFTEWASNKAAYLDTTTQIPITIQVENTRITLDRNEPKKLDVVLKADDNSQLVSLKQVELAVLGMSESGLQGVTYTVQPQWVDMEKNSVAESQINLKAEDNAKPGTYTIMIRAATSERDQLIISKLYPVIITLDVPEPMPQSQNIFENRQDNDSSNNVSLGDITKFLAILVAIGLIGFLIYGRIKRSKEIKNKKIEID
jgi:virginiamycin B lyase